MWRLSLNCAPPNVATAVLLLPKACSWVITSTPAIIAQHKQTQGMKILVKWLGKYNSGDSFPGTPLTSIIYRIFVLVVLYYACSCFVDSPSLSESSFYQPIKRGTYSFLFWSLWINCMLMLLSYKIYLHRYMRQWCVSHMKPYTEEEWGYVWHLIDTCY